MNLHNIYKERGEDFSKLVCSNESCSIDCLENINFNKTTTLAIIDGVIEGMEKEYQLRVIDNPMHNVAKGVRTLASEYNCGVESVLKDILKTLQAQRALITKE